jgi:3-isopropylmalate/(R)-2-methylmalate dehydratase large subunit
VAQNWFVTARTLFDKIWDQHVVRELDDGWAVLHIDRHVLHDLSGPPALDELASRSRAIHSPSLTFATPDHLVSSSPDRQTELDGAGTKWESMRSATRRANIPVFDVGSGHQGIVHVMGPELGLVLPGSTLVCSDSHTCTNGALGAIALGVGSSQSSQVLAAQVLRLPRPRSMRITIDGLLPVGVTAKDVALGIIATFGTAAANGCAVEYAGSTVRAMTMEERMTLCNLSVELGARTGIVAPDDTTLEWLAGRPYAPIGVLWDQAVAAWTHLKTDANATFAQELHFEATTLAPLVTWGTSPEHGIAISGRVPDPLDASSEVVRNAWIAAQQYMDLRPGQPLEGLPIQHVFIGSCANSRLSDLREAARVVKGRKVASHVTAWVVPGSEQVRREAEAEGLHTVFEDAGFVWRRPGCSMCVAANGERVPPFERCVSTSNRNFVGRQGPNARTHLASPAMAAAAAIIGALTDVRNL